MSNAIGTEPAPNAFALEVPRRLPLAEAFHTAWGYIAADPVLDDLFDRHRGRCYQDRLTFPELVRVLADALTRYQGRGRGAILDAAQRGRISCQARAVYGKLARLPLPLAEAFLTALTQRLRPLVPAAARPAALPASLAGLWVVVIDGEKIKRVAKRLPAEGVAVALAADVAGPRVWVADRQFRDLIRPRRFADGGDHVVVRYGHNPGSPADPERPPAGGTAVDGRAIRHEWGWLGAASQGERRLYVRRVTLVRPGGEELSVEEVVGGVSVPGGDGPMRNRWRRRLGGSWSPRWAKGRTTKPRPQKPPPRKSGGHASVYTLLPQAKPQPTILTPLPQP